MDEPGLFRLYSPQSPTTRQTTRTLQELGGGRLSGIFNLREMGDNLLNQSQGTPGARQNGLNATNPNNTINANNMNIINNVNNTPPVLRDNNISGSELMFATHTPSPDEAVIQARGRRQVPLTFSPDVTPLRQQMQRSKLALAHQNNSRLSLPNIRISPRKRLTLSDTPPSAQVFPLTPDLLNLPASPLAKRLKLDPYGAGGPDPCVAAKGLAHHQLVKLLEDIVKLHPGIQGDVVSLLPPPDLSTLEENLNNHKKNIYKSLPNTRLESKTDSMAFNRASTHLTSFRRVVNEGVKQLTAGLQWSAVIDYTIMAWGYVQGTPVWDNPSHNAHRKSCFKTLAAAALAALKAGDFSADQLQEIAQKFKKVSPKSSELDVCVKFIEKSQKLDAES